MDKHKLALLRSYSRLVSADDDGRKQSIVGLEKLYPRTSTPYPDDSHVVEDNEWFAPYGIFRRILENPPKKARVRGMKNVPGHFITGHLIDLNDDNFDFTTISLDSTPKPKKSSMKKKLSTLKKMVKNFFKKFYKNLVRNKCDYSVCPVTCECQYVKSFLNKTIIDESVLESI